MSFVSAMKDKTRLGNTGNVLHEYDLALVCLKSGCIRTEESE
ncbi:MAG: hypothetical protein Q8935_06940 [Bacillota bacterium]|nr:hypothetical protein [Bacillota bacterium]